MINRIRGLFQRYARAHRQIEMPGFALGGPGAPIEGHVDRVVLKGARITFSGWCTAERIRLSGTEGQSTARPDIPRQDVAAARSLPPRVGFEISQGFGDGRFTLSAERRDQQLQRQLQPIPPRRLRAEQRRLALRFGWTLLRLAPQILRALRHGDPAARAAVKSALGLAAVPEAAPLQGQIFASAEGIAPADPVPVTLILPVYNAFDLLVEALERVRAHTDLPWRMILVEDGSSDPRLRPYLRDWAAARNAEHPGRVELIEHAVNRGFIAAVNAGFARALELGDHVIILNSDAFVPAGWASRLLRPILARDDTVATVTPMSNDAEIFSVPAICQAVALAPGQGDAIDAVARRFHPDVGLAAVPTGVGFCMAINIAWLRRLPALDPAFGRGYGEEVDWCQKVRAMGGQHLGLPGLFVEHRGGSSFGSAAKQALVARNNDRIARRYPGYDAEVQHFLARDPLVTGRLALALAWAGSLPGGQPGGQPETGAETQGETGAGAAETAATAEGAGPPEIAIYLAHSLGGGAEHYLRRRIAEAIAAEGRPAVVLRVGGGAARWQLELVGPTGTTAGSTDDFALIEQLLAPIRRRRIVYSCGVGDSDPVSLPEHLLRLRRGPADRIEVLVHDFFMLSPSYTLLDSDGIYRGPLAETDPARDPRAADRAHGALRPDGRAVDLAGWRAAWAALLRAADEVVCFSEDSRAQIRAAHPDLADRLVLRPHALLAQVPAIPRPAGPGRVIGVLGNIGYQKGAALVAELGRMHEAGELPPLVVIGNVDPAYMPPASVPVHGSYQLEDLPGLVARYGITDWLVPSIWPETFSYTTHETLATGLPVHAFDIGAQGEAVRRAANGRPVAFGDGTGLAARLRAALLAAPSGAADGGQAGDGPAGDGAAGAQPRAAKA